MTDAPMPPPRLCPRCGLRPCRAGQRWCAPCHLLYKRERRALRRETGRETGAAITSGSHQKAPANQQNGVVPIVGSVSKKAPPPAEPPPEAPAPYTPFDGLPAKRRPAWCDVYLQDLAARGLKSLAAAKAGVHRDVVRRYTDIDAEFVEELDVAQEYYRDYLEWESVTLGRVRHNPLPYFARLKAERPSRYIDRSAVVVGSSSDLGSADGRALLQAMLGHATESTQRALALPAPPEPAAG